MTVNIIENSYGRDYLKMDDDYFEAFKSGKKENYQKIYGNEKLEKVYEEQIHPMFRAVFEKLLSDMKNHDKHSVIYTHHMDYLKELTCYYADTDKYALSDPADIVVDYMASMTDDYFIDLYDYLFPGGSHKVNYIGYFGSLSEKEQL
jgi:dGTPase